MHIIITYVCSGTPMGCRVVRPEPPLHLLSDSECTGGIFRPWAPFVPDSECPLPGRLALVRYRYCRRFLSGEGRVSIIQQVYLLLGCTLCTSYDIFYFKSSLLELSCVTVRSCSFSEFAVVGYLLFYSIII